MSRVNISAFADESCGDIDGRIESFAATVLMDFQVLKKR